jgi:hypothetical protein
MNYLKSVMKVHLKKFLLTILLVHLIGFVNAQSTSDSVKDHDIKAKADDPTQFFTRTELFSELQHHADFYLNLTTLRSNVKLGKRFTTRIDIPFGYNSLSTPAKYKQFGLSDISFRLLGYKFFESPKSAFTASVEFSLNTAQSSLLGTGKNLIIPMVSFSTRLNQQKMILAFVLQQTNSFSGDPERADLSFTKFQPVLINTWSKKMWTVLAPEIFVDYIKGGVSMNLEGRTALALSPRFSVWTMAGAGIFGDFIARYNWSLEVGCRYFFLRNTLLNRNNSG